MPVRDVCLMKASKYKVPNYCGLVLLPQTEVFLPRGPGSAQSWPEAEEERGGRAPFREASLLPFASLQLEKSQFNTDWPARWVASS